MPRVRNHAAEYARLKARAQAAGLSTRAFRRARKADPAKYYSPRAQVTLNKKRSAILTLIDAQKSRGVTITVDVAKQRLEHATPAQRTTFSRDYQQWVLDGATGERYYLDDDLYDDLGFLLYYHD